MSFDSIKDEDLTSIQLNKRDKIGDYEDWKDGHDAFRKNAISALESLHRRVNELELIMKAKVHEIK